MDKYFNKVKDCINSKDAIDKMVVRLNRVTIEENLRDVKILLDNNPSIRKLDQDLVEEIIKNQNQ